MSSTRATSSNAVRSSAPPDSLENQLSPKDAGFAAALGDEVEQLVLRPLAVGERVEHAAAADHAAELGDAGTNVRHVVQQVHRHDDIEGVIGERQRLHVGAHPVSMIDERQPTEADVERDELTRPLADRRNLRAGPAFGVEHTCVAQRRERVVEPRTRVGRRLAEGVDRWPSRVRHGCQLVELAIVDPPSMREFPSSAGYAAPEMPSEETEKERLDRELIELLNELRVALPGVQVLFAFLLTLPFTDGWDRISAADRRVYVAAVLLTAASVALLMAPTAHHRIRFRDHVKAQMLRVVNKLAIGGLALLAAAMACVLWLIVDVVYGATWAAWIAAVFGAAIVALWFVVPLLYRDDA